MNLVTLALAASASVARRDAFSRRGNPQQGLPVNSIRNRLIQSRLFHPLIANGAIRELPLQYRFVAFVVNSSCKKTPTCAIINATYTIKPNPSPISGGLPSQNLSPPGGNHALPILPGR